MNNIKFSIITVVFNEKEKIRTTIESILSQTYKNIQYIVIDGNSTDGTCEVIGNYIKNIDVYLSENDNGIYDAMNKGVKKCVGDFIIFMNAGDFFYSNDVLENVASKIDKKDTNYFGDYYRKFTDIVIRQNENINIFYKNICHQSIFYSKEALNKNLYNLKYKILADWDLNLRIAKNWKFKYIPIIIASYEGDGISAQRRDNLFYKDIYKNIKKSFGFKNVFNFFMFKLFYKLERIINEKIKREYIYE